MKYTVALESGSVGTLIDIAGNEAIDTMIEEGQTVTIKLQDENGNPIKETGKLQEILNSCEDWQTL